MIEKLKKVNALTMAFLIASCVAIAIMVANDWKAEQIGIVAGALVGVAAQFDKLVGGNDSTPPPPGAALFPFIVCFGVIQIVACSSKAKAVEAESAYANDEARCYDALPDLRAAPIEVRRAGWAQFDRCIVDVHAKWGIVDATRKDGGQ